MRRSMRSGHLIVVLAAIGALVTAAVLQKGPHIPPAKQLTLLRMQIVQTAKDLEAAKVAGVISDPLYTRGRIQVIDAVKCYNGLVGRFKQYGSFTRSEKQQVVLLVAAAAATLREARRGGSDGR